MKPPAGIKHARMLKFKKAGMSYRRDLTIETVVDCPHAKEKQADDAEEIRC
jgi:hypothetical protein